MLSVRNTILGALGLAILSLVIAVVSMMGDPDSDGAAVDSFGTSQDGYRAVYELLHEIQVPVERQIGPPNASPAESATYVLWTPHGDLIENEPIYLQRMIPWVEAGGRLVISLTPADRETPTYHEKSSSEIVNELWKTIGLTGVRLNSFHMPNPNGNRPSDHEPADPRTVVFDDRRMQQSFEKMMGLFRHTFTTVSVEATGIFKDSEHSLHELQVPYGHPGDLSVSDNSSVIGTVESKKPDGTAWTLAAAFSRGKGSIVVVADPMLLMNASLSKADNSLFAYDLLARQRSKVIFDEFYHGLGVRGNPLWLLTKPQYAVFVVAILFVCGLEIWRRAIVLGPPLELRSPTRRSVVEYINAMAPFLNKARGSRTFLLNEVRSGLLRTVGDRLGLAPANHDVDSIARVMAKRSEVQADDFRETMKLLDQSVEKGHRAKEAEAVRILQRISRCL